MKRKGSFCEKLLGSRIDRPQFLRGPEKDEQGDISLLICNAW